MITIQENINHIAADAMRIIKQIRQGLVNADDVDTLQRHIEVSIHALRTNEHVYNEFIKGE